MDCTNCPSYKDNPNTRGKRMPYGNCLIKKMMFNPERNTKPCEYRKSDSELTDEGKRILMERLL